MPIQEKRCRQCDETKAVAEFPRNDKLRDGYDSYCRACRRANTRASAYKRLGRAAPAQVRQRRMVVVKRDETGALVEKGCPDCGVGQPRSAFPSNKNGVEGIGSYCKPCHNARGAVSRSRLHGGARHYRLVRRYGISAADVDVMIQDQGGLCAACQEKPAEHVDHDHDTGVVRGILCFTCNVALGNIKDRRDLLLGLVDYLEAHAPEVAAARDLASHRLSVVLPVEPGPVSARIGQRVQVAPGVWRLTVAA